MPQIDSTTLTQKTLNPADDSPISLTEVCPPSGELSPSATDRLAHYRQTKRLDHVTPAEFTELFFYNLHVLKEEGVFYALASCSDLKEHFKWDMDYWRRTHQVRYTEAGNGMKEAVMHVCEALQSHPEWLEQLKADDAEGWLRESLKGVFVSFFGCSSLYSDVDLSLGCMQDRDAMSGLAQCVAGMNQLGLLSKYVEVNGLALADWGDLSEDMKYCLAHLRSVKLEMRCHEPEKCALHLAELFPSLTRIKLCEGYVNTAVVESLEPLWGQIEGLELESGSFSRNQDENLDVLISIIKKVSKLRSLDLNIHALDLTDAQYQKLAPYLSNLEELHLNQAEIKDQGLECLLNACPKLKSLSLQWAESLRGRAAHILKEYIKRNPLLESLDVQGSGALAWRARDLQKAFPQLKRVEYISLS